MPGHGFSFAPNQSRFGLCEIAESLKTLMLDVLGYDALLAHGHDWAAFVATRVAYAHAKALKGIHITLAIPRKPSATRRSPGNGIIGSWNNGCEKRRVTPISWAPSRRPWLRLDRFAHRPRCLDYREIPQLERSQGRHRPAFHARHPTDQHHDLLGCGCNWLDILTALRAAARAVDRA